jgi:hypothetical protein
MKEEEVVTNGRWRCLGQQRLAIARLWLMYYKDATPCMFPQNTSPDVIADRVLSSGTVQE